MEIQHKENGHRGKFFLQPDDKILAELTYMKRGEDTMVIEHTEVDDALKGQQVGYKLVDAAVRHARQHQMKIVPLCTFANALIHKKPEFQDVLSRS